jgi:hypothetical protein
MDFVTAREVPAFDAVLTEDPAGQITPEPRLTKNEKFLVPR